MGNSPQRSKARWALGVLQIAIALGALPAGIGLVTDPTGGALGLATELLVNAPFDTYLIPGLLLLSVNGLATLFGAFLTLRKHRHAGDVAVVLGGFLMVWIVAQAIWFPVSWLQPTFLAVGVLEVALGAGLKAYGEPDPTPPELDELTPIL